MAEIVAVRNLFTRFGMPASPGGNRTLTWLVTNQGIDSAEAISMVNDTVLKALLKQLSTDARDLPAAEQPIQGVMVTSAITIAIFAVRWYVGQRGQAANLQLLQLLDHNNARDFYLKHHKYSKLVMSPKPLKHREELASSFKTTAEWFEFYGDVKEEIPSDAPEPCGKSVEITAWVDADHAGDKLTRRSHTGIIIFVMSAPIFWYSKRQATIESSTFGSEIVAMRTCLEFVKDLRYKLRMLGVPLDGPAIVWCDNQTVVNGASVPEAKLSKKHLGICYHAVREASAAKIWQVGFTPGKYNIADCLTKILSGTALEKQVNMWMWRK